MYAAVPLIWSWTMLLSLAWAFSQSLSWMLFEASAIFDRKATSAVQRSNLTVSRSTAVICLKIPVYDAEFAPEVYFGRLAQSTAVAGYASPVNAAWLAAVLAAGWLAPAAWLAAVLAAELADGLAEPLQAANTIASVARGARRDHRLDRDIPWLLLKRPHPRLSSHSIRSGAPVPRAIGP